jgi:multiple sugar transport system substrate-binding protein
MVVVALAACGQEEEQAARSPVVTVWSHSAQPSERETLKAQVERFNSAQDEATIRLTIIPEGSYTGQVQASALAGDLPDLLEFDGPYVYNYVWQGILQPLTDLLPESLKSDLLPSILAQGRYNGVLYSVGAYDSGLGLYGRRELLEAAGVRIPHGPEEAWSVTEFETGLAALAEKDPDGAVLDLKLNYSGEWFPYAVSPILLSAGGGLIDREGYDTANGVLNGPKAVAAMERLQGWFKKGYVDPNLDDAAFTGGRVALSWVGHWEYGRYRQAWGDDLVVMPLPDFGEGSRTGQGSWNWGIPRSSKHPELAARFLEFLLKPEEILTMTDANGAVPATRTAIGRSERYAEGQPLHLFATQLMEGYAVPRPRTPAYPVISSVFTKAFHDIRNGADVKKSLDEAVKAIDRDIEMNNGYPDVAARETEGSP